MLVETNGIRLHVEGFSGNGPAVLFLHFGGNQWSVWREVIPYFREGYQVIALDLRGHGRSDKPEAGYDLATMAADVAGVLDALGVAAAHLVGSSLGAEVGVAFGAAYPGRALSLALEGLLQNAFGPHGLYDVADAEAKKAELRARRAGRAPLVGRSPEEVLGLLMQRWGRPNHAGPFEQAMRENIARREDGLYGLLCPDRVTDAYLEHYWDARFDQLLEQVRCPVLFLPDESYTDDRARASLDWFRSKLAVSDVAVIDGATHAAVVLDHPGPFARAVLSFHTRIKEASPWRS